MPDELITDTPIDGEENFAPDTGADEEGVSPVPLDKLPDKDNLTAADMENAVMDALTSSGLVSLPSDFSALAESLAPDPDAVTLEDVLEAVSDDDAISNQQILDAVNDVNVQLAAYLGGVYDGNISSTVLDYFDRFSSKIGILDDYLLYRSGQFTYNLTYGDLIQSGTRFVGRDLDTVTITTYTNQYNSGYDISFSSGDTLDINVGSEVVYSNLGNYPALKRDANPYDLPLLVAVLVALACSFIRPWFNFTLRPGSVTEEVKRDDYETV